VHVHPSIPWRLQPCLRQYLELLHVREANAVLKDKCSKCVIYTGSLGMHI
jgi:hypothetical protein